MKKDSKVKAALQKLTTVIALLALIILFTITMPNKFPRIANVMNILKQASINCLISAGMLLALITAGIDLSVGSNCVLATCTIGVMVQNFGITNPFLLVVAGLAVSTFFGFINGTLLTRLDLPHPFVSTMGTKNVLLGIALLITGSKSIAFTNAGIDSVMWIGSASLFATKDASGNVAFPGIPVSFILVIIVFILFDIFLKRTALGRQIYCCGGNPEAARLSGIPSKNVLTFVYTLSGFMAGLAGIVCVGRLASANANAGMTYDNDAIAACVIGGASFRGGKGTIWGTLIGALLMAVIRNGLNLAGAKNDIQYIVIGSVIILAVTIDVFRTKIEAKARKMAAQ